jgi:hypothetical protein
MASIDTPVSTTRINHDGVYHIRHADEDDARALADLHAAAAIQQPGAFLPQLGLRFLMQYYRILLQERNTVILCAVDINDRIVGFISGTLFAQDHFAHLNRNKLKLFFSLKPRVIFSMGLIEGLWHRTKIVSDTPECYKFVVPSGCRIEYWAWDPHHHAHSCSVLLLIEFMKTAHENGVKSIRLEVDEPNRRVWVTHLMLGAKIIARFRTPDGRNRLIMEHTLGNGSVSPKINDEAVLT